MKIDNKIKGKSGEVIAAKYFKSNKYRILNTNYTTNLGEIDLIVTDEKILIFVEVKTRLNADFGYPSEAVAFQKQRKISQVASQYIKQFRLFDIPVRFDVVEVYLEDNCVNHIENAFDSYLRY